ncbi:methyl-accepting chemotaxis protein [Bosea sp. NBC_00550]|uniref:methyl-accepting chemotaxis protein n=1 Tax=Bosea sp. NBC_00550 TaxID=2969621 RepID=UPI002231B3DF|nr:methyl-accepting chemotaxis protein [Bosea sp. NBC_00550]UZF93488.1 methyl-accepting chemotaxis protein [Bosea sp. NBC_00550]
MIKKLKIGQRLVVGFGIILVMLIALAVVSVDRVGVINDGLTTINDVNSVKQRFAINFRGSVHDRAISLRDVSLGGARDLQANVDDIARLAENYRKSAVALDALYAGSAAGNADEQRILASIKETEAKTMPLIAKVIDLQRAGDGEQAKSVLMTQAKPLFTEWLGRINQFIDLEEAKNQALGHDVRGVAQSFTLLTMILCGVGLLVGGTIAWWSLKAISPLRELTGIMTRFAEGDLQPAVPHADRKDEVGAMAAALQIFQGNLQKIRALEEQERTEAKARLERADSMARIVSDIGEVVASAAAGDFSARLEIEQADEQMQQLVAGINEINAVVDSATTEFAGTLSAVAAGDLTQTIATAYRGRFADLKGAINDTVERLSATVRTIQVTSSDVGLAAREINMGANDLSKRTEEQASSLEETAATTEQLAASVKASAQASRQATQIAEEAMSAAQSGGTIAGQAVDAMARIETASQKISDIIRVIDDIAFQTNLLALNAAVEAARAGDAGKGFAVVASEVRTLAQRSGEAAKDISGLISSSNIEVGEGVKLVRQAGDALQRILEASQRVSSTISDISSAASEQANGIDEMSQAVAHLDEMTQQNAALAEESAASAASLSDKIAQLNGLVSTFRTGGGDSGFAAKPVIVHDAAAQQARDLRKIGRAMAPSAPARGRAVNESGWSEF